jgi:uncharacterized protein YoxC
MDADMFFKIVICTLCCISLIAFIFLIIKLIITLNKVDKLVEDITEKSKKVDGVFNIVDKVTDTVSSVSDKLIGTIFNAITGLTNKFKRRKDDDYE